MTEAPKVEVCPLCGKRVIEWGVPKPAEGWCSPLSRCKAWKVVGKSKNGGPLLHIVGEKP